MNYLAHFHKHKFKYEVTALLSYFLINATVLATSVVMEAKRQFDTLPFGMWEPFVWEYTSALSSLSLFPLIVYALRRFPLDWQAIRKTLLLYGLFSVMFSFLHVGLMVAMRKGIYWLADRSYDFGQLGFELFYEYRKDLWSFIFIILLIKTYQFVVKHLQGEANIVQEGEEPNSSSHDAQEQSKLERLLVKKLGKEFIIQIADVEWLESSGNYVNLHIKDRIYPIRSTLTALIKQIEGQGFCRIHRSHAIRLDMVESITPLPSGDSEVKLKNQKTLMLSRRYKDALKSSLGQQNLV